MDDRLDPRFAAAVRGALLAEVRGGDGATVTPLRPRRRSDLVLAGVIAAVAVIVIVIAGFSTAGLGKRTEPAGPGYRQPVQPFEGDCAAILSDARAGDLIGTAVRTSNQGDLFGDGVERVPVRLTGALRCVWAGRSAAESESGLELVTASSRLDQALTSTYDCFSGSAGGPAQWTCGFDDVEGDVWYSGFLTSAVGTSKAATEAARDRLLGVLRGRASDADPVLPTRSDDAWHRIGCDALLQRAALPRLLGDPGTTAGRVGGSGPVSRADTAAATWSRETGCVVEDTDDDGTGPFVEVLAFPDGAWLRDRVAAVRPVASQRPDPPEVVVTQQAGATDTTVAWVFDGPNAMRLTGARLSEARLRTVAAAVARVLDAAR